MRAGGYDGGAQGYGALGEEQRLRYVPERGAHRGPRVGVAGGNRDVRHARGPDALRGFACAGLPKGGMRLNHRLDFDANAVRMASGVPYAICDAYIPAAKIDLEYNGAGHEVENARIHDGQRNNGLKGMGVTVLVINRDQMRDVSALEAMARSIYKAAGRQFRYTFKGYRLRQEGLLSDLRKGIGLPGA